jgi:hypothetical protein
MIINRTPDTPTTPQPLRDWLIQHHAALLWSTWVRHVGYLTRYRVNAHVILIQAYQGRGHPDGWEVYLPVQHNDVYQTLCQLAAHCQLEPPQPSPPGPGSH